MTEWLMEFLPLDALAEAARDMEGVERLMEASAKMRSKKWVTTPVHAAVQGRHKLIVDLLLDAGHSVNTYDDDDEHRTPLHLAVEKNYVDIVELLLRHGAFVNAKDYSGKTPLHRASQNNSTDITQMLLKHGADVTAADYGRQTPLHLACKFKSPDTTRLLLDAGSDVNVESCDWRSALEHALCYGVNHCVPLIINHCAMLSAANLPVSVSNQRRKAPEHFRLLCKAEVDKMKATKFDSVSLYDVLVSDVDRVASLLRNDALRSLTAQDMTGLFPIYSSMIVRVVKRATKRLLLLDDAMVALEGLTQGRLPPELLRELTKYLDDEDLSSVTVAYQGFDLGDRKR